MQQLDAITLKNLATELQSLLDNAKVSKVQHPSAHEFLITFWGGPARPRGQDLFYIHLNPEMPFCTLTDNRHRQETALHTFDKPTALCMLLRKHLNGANVSAVRALPAERVLEVVFENFNELGNRVRLVLSLELMGKHTNMLLYDEIQGVILAVAHGVGEHMSSLRELAPGLPYAAPPVARDKRQLASMTIADFTALWEQKPADESAVQWLNRRVAGVGQRMASDVLALNNEPRKLYHCLEDLEAGRHLSPAISEDGERFTLLSPPIDRWIPKDSVNRLITDYFLPRLRTIRLKRRKQQLDLILEQHTKKLQKKEKELVPIADTEIDALQAAGDRLLAAMSAREVPSTPTGHQGRITLSRYEDGTPWEIEIDPSVGWVENAQTYYRRARKAKARREVHQQMSAELANEQAYIADLRQLVGHADSLKDLNAIEADMTVAGFSKKGWEAAPTGKGKSMETTGVMSLRSSDGLEVLIGKSAQGNEAIVGKLSKPDDLWLHVHQMPGSHILVRCGREPVPDQTLLEASTLAVWYSSASQSLNVPVVYTQAKFVRKIPNSYPGHVNYRQEQTVFITPEPALVQELLNASG
jgi:predicted ribosome quality control (RQC) complex YloA/Tae2 family protein